MIGIAQKFSEVRSGGRGEFQLCVREVGTANELEALVEFCELTEVNRAECFSHEGRLLPNGGGTRLQFFVAHGPTDPALYFEVEDFSAAPLEKWHRAACVAGDMLPQELGDRMLDEYGADLGAAAWLALMWDQGCFEAHSLDYEGVRWCYACEASVELCKRLQGNGVDEQWTGYHSPARWRKAWQVGQTTWRRRKREMGGKDHPSSGSKLVRFRVNELAKMGLSEPQVAIKSPTKRQM